MKLEKAYSLELEERINAPKADELYKRGKITSKYKFECPDETCNSPVTCANLEKPNHLRKRDPYYTFVGDISTHSDDCAIKADIISAKRSGRRVTDELYGDEDEYFDHAVRVNLNLHSNRRPDDEKGTSTSDDDSDIRLTGTGTGEESGKRKIQRSRTIGSLIDAYLNGESFVVQLEASELINLQDLFIEIKGQDISVLPDEPRIYYGKAWFNKKETGFAVNFANNLACSALNLIVRPSFFIGDSVIEATTYKKFSHEILEKLSDNRPKTVFIWSGASPRPSKNDQYINFYLGGFEYMDYRS